jgi:hypothetical protein
LASKSLIQKEVFLGMLNIGQDLRQWFKLGAVIRNEKR